MKRKREKPSVDKCSEKNNPASCPSYGSQEYWDQRYKGESNNSKKDSNSKTDEGEPGFSWYFNYDELKPLLLPLCIGRNDGDDDWSNVEEDEEFFEVEEEETYEIEEESENIINCKEANENGETIDQELREEIKETEGSEESVEKFCTDQSYVPRRVLEIGCGGK